MILESIKVNFEAF